MIEIVGSVAAVLLAVVIYVGIGLHIKRKTYRIMSEWVCPHCGRDLDGDQRVAVESGFGRCWCEVAP